MPLCSLSKERFLELFTYSRFQILKAANMKMSAVWDLALRSAVEVHRRFRSAYCHHHDCDESVESWRPRTMEHKNICCHVPLLDKTYTALLGLVPSHKFSSARVRLCVILHIHASWRKRLMLLSYYCYTGSVLYIQAEICAPVSWRSVVVGKVSVAGCQEETH
jgi:hypothetical protein